MTPQGIPYAAAAERQHVTLHAKGYEQLTNASAEINITEHNNCLHAHCNMSQQ